MVLGRKTNFFLGKTKKTIFLEFGRIVFSKDGFFGGFLVFPRKKLVFLSKNHLFPRKKLVFLSKNIFFLGKTKKNHLFGVWPQSVSKDGFFGFFGSLGKVGFGLGGYSAAVDFVLTSNLNELTDMSC